MQKNPLFEYIKDFSYKQFKIKFEVISKNRHLCHFQTRLEQQKTNYVD